MNVLNWIQICLFLTTCMHFGTPDKTHTGHEANLVRVPIGGNSWVTNELERDKTISKDGLTNWSSPASTVTTYVRFDKAGSLNLSINLRVADGKSRLRVTLLGQSKEVDVQGSTFVDYPLGQWSVAKAGYIKIVLQGISKTGATYADVTNFGISGEVIDERTAFVRDNEGNFFYWGRRGPSVHLRYPIPDGVEAEWFYNEVTVPKGSDIIGSYYMANGFGEGYFGMQVNSPTERRILFSVWSPFKTDNPSQIPDDQKILLDRKGADVVTNDFGNEGSGGQSYLRYNWVAGQTYKFLLRGQPVENGYTTYTAYFRAPDATNWQLIASFKRPKTTTYLKSLYSFLENFTPQTGNIQREVDFSNQWVRSRDGQWQELTKAQFTGDNTAKKAFRMDYAGGLKDNKRFFLRNCGFFDTYTPLKTDLTRPAQPQSPNINVAVLP
ncbi:DUF3472 domain-containing protein [Spirosoma validum]|uniref:DUF5077 domain-containing protein n=1 Tax=Spirosoma validum TaxID=2771355 RepID=A0A927GGF1_9BACT|nr:DUF3472 domain-containing protein [Spirosoma validum]MBD2756806.1 DUF5077 domain-containing protein [Spirosoma validum]